jgi:hypothetical protein
MHCYSTCTQACSYKQVRNRWSRVVLVADYPETCARARQLVAPLLGSLTFGIIVSTEALSALLTLLQFLSRQLTAHRIISSPIACNIASIALGIFVIPVLELLAQVVEVCVVAVGHGLELACCRLVVGHLVVGHLVVGRPAAVDHGQGIPSVVRASRHPETATSKALDSSSTAVPVDGGNTYLCVCVWD